MCKRSRIVSKKDDDRSQSCRKASGRAAVGVLTVQRALRTVMHDGQECPSYYDGVYLGPPVSPITNPPSFGPRQGDSYFVLGAYLFPQEFWLLSVPGKFQVLGRFQHYDRDTVGVVAGGVDEAVDVQLNYMMFGHNARVSAVWTQLDTPIVCNQLVTSKSTENLTINSDSPIPIFRWLDMISAL